MSRHQDLLSPSQDAMRIHIDVKRPGCNCRQLLSCFCYFNNVYWHVEHVCKCLYKEKNIVCVRIVTEKEIPGQPAVEAIWSKILPAAVQAWLHIKKHHPHVDTFLQPRLKECIPL